MTAEDSITFLQFQILGSSAKDVEHEYQITIFGATAEGYSVSLAVTGFEPYFYVELPANWSLTDRATYQQFLTKRLNAKDKNAVTFSVEKHKSFWDFTSNRLFTFLKVQAKSKRLWTKLRDMCQDRETCLPIPYNGETLRVFEANIDPMLRFFHLRELKPAGWLFVHEDHWEQVEDPTTTTVIQATTEVAYVCPASAEVQLTAAPLKIMSWDIECTSSHGDFPLAVKDWRKPAREIVAAGLKDWATVEAAILAATATTGVLSRIYLGPAGIRELTLGLKAAAEEWTSTVGDDAIDKVSELLSRHLPPPEGDPIIQIGCVLYINNKAVRKDIFVLGSCTPVADQGAPTHTHVCATEGALIRGWCRLIQEIDPDIMVGYNIFGFDDKYLWDRAAVTRTTDALKAFSRCTDKEPELQEKRLSSSAMGDNIFHVITGLGRLHIDLLAYVRRNAVLDSYSLDNVTATFMSGSVVSAAATTDVSAAATTDGLWTIKTKSTKGTSAGRYMVIMDEENDVIGDKLEIVAVEPKALHVRMLDGGASLKEHSLPPVRWSQAKDDVSPKEIFALHAQGPSERAKVAKYCIQDCDLVMELMQKLEVLNNSVAMANVCWVPVEFIFTRGQGIKSESLVFYECRKEGQLIPVLPAPPQRREAIAEPEIAEVPEIIQDDNEGYEGAIVLDPLSGIYLDNEPVAALDFSSLYPSSIISENLSHDSVVWVKDYDLKGQLVAVKEGSETYDNLPGWEYLEVDYDILRSDPHDKRKHPPLKPAGRRVCRFAQPVSPDGKTNNHNEKSTLPKILQKLLSQRKATRKLA